MAAKPDKLDSLGTRIRHFLQSALPKPILIRTEQFLNMLNSSVADNGDNWSVGQRQLLCLGRVMLKHSKVLFMDEATASVDSQTDAVIQRIIREDFAACTIISIAHRIPTVMDCNRVLVIDAGLCLSFFLHKKKFILLHCLRSYCDLITLLV